MINLNNIFKQQNQDGDLPKWAKDFALEACRQVLELAKENARVKYYYHGSGVDYAEIQNDSITNTINQVK